MNLQRCCEQTFLKKNADKSCLFLQFNVNYVFDSIRLAEKVTDCTPILAVDFSWVCFFWRVVYILKLILV